jgi:hypothetical protein
MRSAFALVFGLCVGIHASIGAIQHLYTRGFLFSTSRPAYIPENYRQITESLWVDSAQQLTFSKDKQCCLIGFCVDIRKPKSSVQTLVHPEAAFHRYGGFLCGRYVIFYTLPHGSCRLVTDATGFRHVFHDAAASSPKLCEAGLPLLINPSVMRTMLLRPIQPVLREYFS